MVLPPAMSPDVMISSYCAPSSPTRLWLGQLSRDGIRVVEDVIGRQARSMPQTLIVPVTVTSAATISLRRQYRCRSIGSQRPQAQVPHHRW